MKISIRDSNLAEWFLCHIGGSDPDKLDKVIKKEGWNAKNIEFSISLNGVEFPDLGDLFKRLDEHIKNKAEELAGQDTLINAKIDAMYQIMNATTMEELNRGY